MSSIHLTAALAALALLFAGCASSKDDGPEEVLTFAQPALNTGPASQPAQPPASQPGPASRPAKSPAGGSTGGAAEFDAAMIAVVAPYLVMQDALARDTTDGVAEAAKALAAAATQLDPKAVTGDHAGHYADVPTKLKAGAEAVAAAPDLAGARAAFKTLSMPLGMWATMAKPADLDLVYCPMAKGSWLQKSGAIRNPYHGSEMLACGEVVSGPGKMKGHP